MKISLDWNNYNSEDDYTKLYHHLFNKKKNLTDKELLLYALSCYEIAEMQKFEELFHFISTKKFSGLDLILFYYLEARFQRLYNNDLEKAIEITQKAEKDLKSLPPSQIHITISNFLAVCLVENGKVFLGLDKLEELLSKKEYENFDLSFVISNKALHLCQLGRFSALEELLPYIQEGMQIYYLIVIDSANGSLQHIRSILNDKSLLDVRLLFRCRTIELIVLSIFVLGNIKDLKQLKKSWIIEEIKDFCSNKTEVTLMAKCLILLGLKDKSDFKKPSTRENWRFNLYHLFFDMLICVSRNQYDEAQKILEAKITPLCHQYNYSYPLIPYLRDKTLYPASKWATKLASILKLDHQVLSEEISAPRLIISSRTAKYLHGEKKLTFNFSSSPVAIKFLQFIVGEKGTSFTKQEIHENLSQTKYNAFLHDSRLQKLANRISKRLIDEGVPKPWFFPRNHTLELMIKIENSFDGGKN